MQPEHNWMKYVLNEQSDFIHQFNIQATKKMKKYLVKSQMYGIDAVTLSRILKAKQKLGRTFNSDKLGSIDFTKISKLTMCSA